MLKKDASFVWNEEGKKAFEQIKLAITKSLVLRNLNFNKEFILYAYGSQVSVVVVLT